jgi:hypothetical protein
VHTRAYDDNIFSNATKCNDDVWALGDVLEVFLGPVEHPTDDPMWYHELDTSATGALWAAETYNTAWGNVSNCNATVGSEHRCTPGLLDCKGLADFGPLTAHVTIDKEDPNKPRWWENPV